VSELSLVDSRQLQPQTDRISSEGINVHFAILTPHRLHEVTRLFLLGRVRHINIIGLRRAHSRYLHDRLPIWCGDEMGHACRFGIKATRRQGN